MKAVWSFWSKPFNSHYRLSWTSEKHHFLSWILSLKTIEKFYPDTALYTDNEGASLLVDRLGLDFVHVSTELNALDNHNPQWWTLGKLFTYRLQKEPFIHFDNDVFLWKPLPRDLMRAPLFTQNPEYFVFNGNDMEYYKPTMLDNAINYVDGWTPKEWKWCINTKSNLAFCCGIIGGRNTEFLNHYAKQAISFIEHPGNKAAWSLVNGKIKQSLIPHNILVEQYLLAGCLGYHREKGRFGNLEIKYLFKSSEEFFNQDHARQKGYTHLLGWAKRDKEITERVENKVKHDYPALYEKCLELFPDDKKEKKKRKKKKKKMAVIQPVAA